MSTVKPVRVGDPKAYVRSACRWIKRNPALFKRLMHLVHMEVDRGNPNVQRGHVYRLARDAGFSITECDELKRDHNLWAILARYMVMLRPRLAKSLSFRPAGSDDVDMQSIWREEVNSETVFLADNWKAAKRACKEGCVSAA